MRSLSARLSAGVVYACALFAVCVVAISAAGILGVQAANRSGSDVAHDELATAEITAAFGHDVDVAEDSGQLLWLNTAANRAVYATTLYNDQVPAVEAALAALRRIHADDGPAELARIIQVGDQWAAMRAQRGLSAAECPHPIADCSRGRRRER
jgi:hypothetical protein